MATVVSIEELRRSPTAALFEGGDQVPVSVFVTRYEPGQGVQLHLHPYPEVFVIETGAAVFTVGEEEITVAEGHIVAVPAQTPHAFRCDGGRTLRVVSVHPCATVEQIDL